MASLAPLAATMIQLAISRTREYQADASGAHLTHNPLLLANALRKLESSPTSGCRWGRNASDRASVYRQSAASGMMSRLFSTHPPIEERIKRLEEMARNG